MDEFDKIDATKNDSPRFGKKKIPIDASF